MTAVRLVESSGSAGTIQVSSGNGGFKPGRIVAGSNVIITSNSSGVFSISSVATGSTTNTIGTPSDGSYTPGLFNNLTPDTTIADAIDKINTILSFLAPSAAPDVQDIVSENVGATGRISFGPSNPIEGYLPITGSAILDNDVNEVYQYETISKNTRLGIFDKTTDIYAVINEYIPDSSPNYAENSFGNGNAGTLKILLNNETIHQIDLATITGTGIPNSGSASYLNSNGSGFIEVSSTGSAVDSSGKVFSSIVHRTAKIKIAKEDQSNGFNLLKVVHSIPTGDLSTNFIEWVNDNNNETITVDSASLSLSLSGQRYVSGIQYYTTGTYEYGSIIKNAYKNVFSTENISSRGTNLTAATHIFPQIEEGEDQNKNINFITSGSVANERIIGSSVEIDLEIPHPLKGYFTGGNAAQSGVLFYTMADDSTSTKETFIEEKYRLVSGSYDTQSDISEGEWNSSIHMNTSSSYPGNFEGHSDGLMIFDGLYRPTAYRSGDFRSVNDGGTLGFGPDNNPDYSSITSGTRTYYRKFINTGLDVRDFKIKMTGSAYIVNNNSSFSANKIKVYVKLPYNGENQTAWLDISKPYVYNQTTENNSGAFVNSFNTNITNNTTNIITLGTNTIKTGDAIVLKIEADASWSGRLDEIEIIFGAGEGDFDPVPDLNELTSLYAGSSLVKLSFGSSNNINGYENVVAIGDFEEKNANDIYAPSESKVLGVFNGLTDIHFLINDSVQSASPNHAADVFSEGNDGKIILEVNGNTIEELSIGGAYNSVGQGSPGSGYGSYLNSTGSGFYHVSIWDVGKYSNNVPDYLEFQRSAKCVIASDQQRNGFNYAKVIHTGSFGFRETNYVQWVNDTNTDPVEFTNLSFNNFEGSTFYYLSGIKYFQGYISSSFSGIVKNAYKNVYSAVESAITIFERQNMEPRTLTVSGSGIEYASRDLASSMPLPNLKLFNGAESEDMIISASFRSRQAFSESYPEDSDTADFKLRILRPLHNPADSLPQGKTKFLIFGGYSGLLTSNINTDERFLNETFRIQSSSYESQSSVTNSSYDWNSQIIMNLTESLGYASGLAFYRQKLQSPAMIGENGDFRNVQEGGIIQSPFENPNYSSSELLYSERTFFRPFKNNTTSDKPSFNITFYGDAQIVGRTGIYSGILGNNKNIYVDIKIPGKTEFLDLGRPSEGSGNISYLDGCLSGDLDQTIDSLGATNTITMNGQTVDGTASSSGEYIVVRVIASKLWTGFLDRISVSWS